MRCYSNWFMYFGTGRWFYKTDEVSVSKPNKLYGIRLDNDFRPNVNFAHSSTICNEKKPNYSWYINLNQNDEGYYPERMITDPTTTKKDAIIFTTMEPTGDICGYGGRTRVWVLNCATGGSLAENCNNYEPRNMKGKILLQLSGGDIHQIDIQDIYNGNDSSVSKYTTWMQGTPPPSSPSIIYPPGASKIFGELLLWIER